MNTKTFQKKQKRKKKLLLDKNRAKYEKKIPVIFLDGTTIRLKQGMANQFKKLYPMPDKKVDQNLHHVTGQKAKEAAPEAVPLTPEKAEVIKRVIENAK